MTQEQDGTSALLITANLEQLPILIHRRGVLKSQLTKYHKFLEKTESIDRESLQVRVEKIEQSWKEYDGIQTQIEFLDTRTDQTADRDNFEGLYYEVIAKTRKLMNLENKCANNVIVSQQNTSFIKLPKINLPSFNGNYENWTNFHETFQSVIHSNQDITDIQKFHYLKSSLTGEASQLIQSLEISSENYNIAWNLLSERFGNKRLIIQNHIKALFELNAVKDSYTGFRHFTDSLHKHLRALKALGEPTDSWDTLLLHIIVSKFDKQTHKEWEYSIKKLEKPTMQHMDKFLKEKCTVLEAIMFDSSSDQNKSKTHRDFQPIKKQSFALVSQIKQSCPLCQQSHYLFNCPKFHNLSVNDRRQEVKKHGICFNCLKGKHLAIKCNMSKCKKCAQPHSTLLHISQNKIENTANGNGTSSQPIVTPTVVHYSEESSQEQVLLSTVIVNIVANDGNEHTCRILLDSGSQSNFIREDLVEKLNLTRRRVHIPVLGLGQTKSLINSIVSTTIKSKQSNFQITLSSLVLPQITGVIPTHPLNVNDLILPEGLKLADPQFAKPSQIDMLIGAESFYGILENGQIHLTNSGPVLQNTKFGWIVTGKIGKNNKSHILRCHLATTDLAESINKFWELEHYPSTPILSQEEQMCEKHFENHTTRDDVGRYVVKLPFKYNILNNLGESYSVALRRFYYLEKRLMNDNTLNLEYRKFIDEYLKLGHMKEVEDSLYNDEGYYMPHHPVIKTSSLSTKVRVVFDASAKTDTGVSLNDALMVGPKTQDDLITIIMRFRLYQFVLTADIEKMYRQVKVHQDDTKYQRIIWRNHPDEDIKIYELQTLTYGTASAPFLATRALKQLAIEEVKNHPVGSKIIQRDFYVDDLLTGANTVEDAIAIRDDVNELLSKAGFLLRKWASNDVNLINSLKNQSNDELLQLDVSQSIKVLGLQWHAVTDVITYSLALNEQRKFTKRSILSQIASIFDPLGLVGPVITQAKLIMQKLWITKISWDEIVPLELQHDWQQFIDSLTHIPEITIPRRIVNNAANISLHGFCDASEKAYGACIYVKSTDSNGNSVVNLVCSKSRVAPLKKITLPRLELCSAVLLARLLDATVNALQITFESVNLYSDSNITLCWINTSPNTLKTFVGNRVAEIQRLTSVKSWNHVNSRDNPADIISRGCSATTLNENSLWWSGPKWLLTCQAQSEFIVNIENIPEQKCALSTQSTPKFELITRFSSLTKLKRVTAYILRFYKAIKCKIKFVGPLTVSELEDAFQRILKCVQNETFHHEMVKLQKEKSVSTNSKLIRLSPFLDQEGLLRVGGRLRHANISSSYKHQILLPKNHHLTDLIIRYEHCKQCHTGIQATLYAVRLKFWPIDGKTAVKRIVHNCIVCFKINPSNVNYKMGDIPEYRTQMSRPFTNVGVDFCGPFFIKEKKHRNTKKVKTYVAIYVCLTTKALHLEVVSDLSTEAFLASLRRFFGRRGKVRNMYSDNATNFKGAANQLHELYELFKSSYHNTTLINFLNENNTIWHFIPPRAPHFGGIWEAAVKSFKYHFRRVVGETLLTFEQLNTVSVEIEAILNSRPLTPLSEDPNDFLALSPSHFLIGESLLTISEPLYTHKNSNSLFAWQHLTQMKQHFWNRWYKEYLNQLQIRYKWNNSSQPQPQIGNLVIIKEDGIPPMHWCLGRIIETHAGEDGIIRVVTLKTSNGTCQRPVKKICVLPIEQ